jgi:hypothetical protein
VEFLLGFIQDLQELRKSQILPSSFHSTSVELPSSFRNASAVLPRRIGRASAMSHQSFRGDFHRWTEIILPKMP